MRYRLRTLLILLAIGPPVIGGLWHSGLLPVAVTIWIYAVAFGLISLVGRSSVQSPKNST